MEANPHQVPVSPDNPCPVLRALVAGGQLQGETATLRMIGDIAARLVGGASTPDRTTGIATFVVAMFANGPLAILRNLFKGAQLDHLRGGPLDKKGGGSGILDAHGQINAAELARLDQFASDKTDASGTTERGLDAEALTKMLDANFARAAGRRRFFDRKLMDGELPLLLRIMGKPGGSGPYLSVAELRALFVDRQLPERVTARLAGMRHA